MQPQTSAPSASAVNRVSGRGPWGHMVSPLHELDEDLATALDATAARTEEKAIRDNLRATRAANVASMLRAIMNAHKPVYRGDRRKSRLRSTTSAMGLSYRRTLSGITDQTTASSANPESHTGERARAITPRRRTWLRLLFRWAVSRTIEDLRNERARVQAEAKARMEEERRAQRAEEEAAILAARREACAALFGNIASKIKSGVYRRQVLTDARYRDLKHQVRVVCGDKPDLVLSLAEITRLMAGEPSFDLATFRKLDRDHSGYLDLDELLHGFFPSATARDIKAIRQRVDADGPTPSGLRGEERIDAAKILSADSRAAVQRMFQSLDRSRRGVLSASDLERACSDADWCAILDVRSHFGPGGNGFMTLNEFTELVKYAFPPFNGQPPDGASPGHAAREAGNRAIRQPLRSIPDFVLKVQEQTTSSVD